MLTFIHAPGDVIQAAEENTNNDDLLDGQSGITAAQLADNAGVRSGQLLDRFALVPITIHVAPRLDDTGAVVDYTLPDESTSPGITIDETELVIPEGKLAYLIAVQTSIIDTDPDAGVNATWWVAYNGAVLGAGNPTAVTAGGHYYLINDDLVPMASVSNGGTITIGVGRTAEGGGVPTWSGVKFIIWLAVEVFAV